MKKQLLPNQLERCVCDILGSQKDGKASRLQSDIDHQGLFDIANRNRVSGMVAHNWSRRFDHEAPDVFQKVHANNSICIEKILVELRQIGEELNRAGIRCAVLENGALACAYHTCPGCYHFRDLDLLVSEKDFLRTGEILQNGGYFLNETSDGRGVFSRNLDSQEFKLNVQTSLVARRWFHNPFEPKTDLLLERASFLPEYQVYVLNAEDSIFQIIVHNTAHTIVRKPGLSLHLDLHTILSKSSVDWRKLLCLLHEHRCNAAGYFNLSINRHLFGTKIPEFVLAETRPAKLKEAAVWKLIGKAGLLRPDRNHLTRAEFTLLSSMLKDDTFSLLKMAIPPTRWMKERYGFQSCFLLPYFHLRRAFDLVFGRLAT